MYIKQKRNIRLSCMGETRSGKSLTMLKVADIILTENGESLNDKVNYVVCGNQIEYRQKLKDAEFGDTFLVDENLLNTGGMGSMIELQQLKNYNNIIAKKNISLIFIIPDRFLNINATLGLKTYGRDPKNWLSRMLVYKFKESFPYLTGFVIIDVGIMFRKYGCFIYKTIGGCTNPKKFKIEDINPKLIKYSTCISKDYDKNLIVTSGENCPFYNVCNNAMCQYEHKKDSWIEKEMTGGLDERKLEKYKLTIYIILELFKEIVEDDGTLFIKLRVKNKQDLHNKTEVILLKYTNAKMGVMEYKEFIDLILTHLELNTLVIVLKTIGISKLNQMVFNMDSTGVIEKIFKEYKETKFEMV